MRYILLATIAILLGACHAHDNGRHGGPRYYPKHSHHYDKHKDYDHHKHGKHHKHKGKHKDKHHH